MFQVLYEATVNIYMFAMICTRPNITQIVEVISRFMANIEGCNMMTKNKAWCEHLIYFLRTTPFILFLRVVSLKSISY